MFDYALVNQVANAVFGGLRLPKRMPQAVLSAEEIALAIRALQRSSEAMPDRHETMLSRETRAARETRLADKLRRAIS